MKIWYRSILLRGDHCLTWNFHVLNAIKTNQSDKSMAKQHTYVLRKDLYIWYSSDSTDSIYKVYIHVALVFCSFLARICRARHILMMVKEWVWSTFKWNSRQHVNQMKERYTKMMSYDFLWSEIVRILCSISVFSCKWIQPPLKCHLLGDIFMANCWSPVVFGFGLILPRR